MSHQKGVVMKKILCFGDSNTFGFVPENGARYPENIRWSGRLKALLGDKFEVIEAGCNNRTAFSDNPAGFEQTGYKVLPGLLDKTLDCVILAIGINDLQFAYRPDELQIKAGIEKLVNIVKKSAPNAKIVLASPSCMTDDVFHSWFGTIFDEISVAYSQKLSKIYEKIAIDQGCTFIDLNKIAGVSAFDGLHYTPEQHSAVAEAFWGLIKELFS